MGHRTKPASLLSKKLRQIEIFAVVVKMASLATSHRQEELNCYLGRKQNRYPFLFLVGNVKFVFNSRSSGVAVGMGSSQMI